MGLLGLALCIAVDRQFLVLPAFVFGFFFQHATGLVPTASGVSEDRCPNPA
jgi:hypothetical protein